MFDFHRKAKKQALEDYNSEVYLYEKVANSIGDAAMLLHHSRTSAVSVINTVEHYVNELANTPKTFAKDFELIRYNIKSFELLSAIEYDERLIMQMLGRDVGIGVAAGIGFVALAPTAAMAIATTFGTASTGVAISTLSGAAASNAALAWLGGGALAAGGGGMTAGSALLALAGPIGVGIGAITLLFGGYRLAEQNKKTAIDIHAKRTALLKERHNMELIQTEIEALRHITTTQAEYLQQTLLQFLRDSQYATDYAMLQDHFKEQIRGIVNHTLVLSQLFMKDIGQSHEKTL